ncbi:MAG: PstS family phosphate ABC transporter substrate-binding protein [bacterium]|nr:PstS family phosphate ABC transporter substrate-binding protein [bacterium]
MKYGVVGGIVALSVGVIHLFASQQTTIVLDGSTTVGPLAKAFAEHFMQQHPGVKITVSESGSGNGAKSLINGTCHIATMSRAMKPEEVAAAAEKGVKAVAHVVAIDALPVLVHPSNPLTNLTLAQVKDIYLGKITNWKELGGPDVRIVKISRDTNSGTYECFEELVMKKEKMADDVEYVGSNGAVRQRVMTTPAAIGYAGLAFVDKKVKAISINGVAPCAETARNKTYPIARPLYMYTNGEPPQGSLLEQFVNFYKTAKGREITEAIGFVPVN